MQRTYVDNYNRVNREFLLMPLNTETITNIQFQINVYIFFFNSIIDCLPEYYGYRCEKACSGHCLNNTICDHIDGKCSDGCQPGYTGKLCNDCKILNLPSFLYLIIHLWTSLFHTHIICFTFYSLQEWLLWAKLFSCLLLKLHEM